MKAIGAPTWQLRREQEVYNPAHTHGLRDDRTYLVVRTRWFEPDDAGSSRPEGCDLYETADYGEALDLVRRERELISLFNVACEWAVIDTRYADGCRCLG